MSLDTTALTENREDDLVRLPGNGFIRNEKKDFKYGLCKFSSKCWLYVPYNYHCNQARAFDVNPYNPSCFVSLRRRFLKSKGLLHNE